MAICKFFLQGNCKFGDYCKFEHQINDEFNNQQNSRGGGSSILRQSQFVNNQYQNPPQATALKEKSNGVVDEATLVKSVINDMTAIEKGNQWLLSCYSPFRDKPLFPGFEDQSFEEIRYADYEAAKNGTLEQHKQQVQLMLQQAVMRLKSLQNPSPDIVTVLKNIYNTPVPNQISAFSGGNNSGPSSVFNQQQSYGAQGSSIFVQANQNIYNKPQEQQNATGSIFGVTNSKSMFGGQQSNMFSGSPNQTFSGGNVFNQANTNVQTSSSVFNSQPITNSPAQSGQIFNNPAFAAQNTFVGTQEGGSIFGQPSVHSTQPSNMFPSQNVGMQQTNMTKHSTVFGNQNLAVLQQPTNAFSTNSPAQTQQNIFQAGVQQMNTNAFVASPPQTSIFGAPKQESNNIFGTTVNQELNNSPNIQQQMVSNSPFIKSEPQSHTASIFGSANTFNSISQPQQQSVVEEGVYSKPEDLTEEEIKWFESDNIDDFKIPEKPPTYEMCFKV